MGLSQYPSSCGALPAFEGRRGFCSTEQECKQKRHWQPEGLLIAFRLPVTTSEQSSTKSRWHRPRSKALNPCIWFQAFSKPFKLQSMVLRVECDCSELNKARTEVHKVSELFSRRDPMRKFMKQIVEMASEYGRKLGFRIFRRSKCGAITACNHSSAYLWT